MPKKELPGSILLTERGWKTVEVMVLLATVVGLVAYFEPELARTAIYFVRDLAVEAVSILEEILSGGWETWREFDQLRDLGSGY